MLIHYHYHYTTEHTFMTYISILLGVKVTYIVNYTYKYTCLLYTSDAADE